MPASARRKRILMAAGAAAAVLLHLLLGTWAVVAASRWAGGIVIGSAVTIVAALHVVGMRRLAGRRAQAIPPEQNAEEWRHAG